MLRHVLLLALLLAVALGGTADAQLGGPKINVRGAVTSGHCAQWIGPLTIADSGVAC